MRTLSSLLMPGLRHLSWFALPICLFFAAQAFARPYAEFHPPTSTTKTVAPAAVTVSASSNGPLCAGATLNLSATVTVGAAPFTFAWSGPLGFTSSDQNPSRPNTILAHSGTYTVTVTDNTGMTGTATVSVQINPPATVDAGPSDTLCKGTQYQLNGTIGGSASSASWIASVGGGMFMPNPQALNATYSPPANFTGVITLTLTTNDPAGPCPAVSDQMQLTYGSPGPLVCNDTVYISMGQTCTLTVTPDMALETDVLDKLYTVTLFTLQGLNIGNTITPQYVGVPLKIRIQDNCSGNFCITNAIASDVLPPVFVSCQNITVPCVVSNYTPAYLSNVLGIAAAIPQVTENCTQATLTSSDTWVDVPCNGSFNGLTNLSGYVVRVWTATDASGNKSTCTQYIYFQRISIYELTLPTDVTVNCDMVMTDPAVTGAPSYTFNGVKFYITGTNSFCEINATATDQPAPFCDGVYSIIRTWQIFNLCGPSSSSPPNPIIHLQVINVIDPQGPAVACPANLTVSTDPLDCCATVDLPDVIMEDACGRVGDASAVIFVKNPITGDTIDEITILVVLSDFTGNNLNDKDTLAVFGNTPCIPVGQHIVAYIAEDACGASSYCTFTLTVTDNVPPVAACDEITQVTLGIDGMALINASTFDDGSYDNCSPVSFRARRVVGNDCQTNSQFHPQVKFCCEDVGDTILVILRVYDVPVPAGPVSLSFQEAHSNDCEVQVYVDDKLKPVCLAPAHTTISCDNFDPTLWSHGMATGADNCCIDTITTSANWAQFDTLCSRGTIVRTFRVFDCHGQSSSCTQRIVVNYQQNFYVKFPDDVVITACNGSGDYGEPTFFGENCELLGVTHTDQYYTVVPDACTKIERTWTIINWCSYNPNLGCTYVPNPNPSSITNHSTNLAGPVVSPFGTPSPWAPTVAKLTPSDQQAKNFSEYWSPNVNCYQYKQIIKITDTEKPVVQCQTSTPEMCDVTDNNPQMWNESYWYDNLTGKHDLCEGPTDLCLSATDACSKFNVNFRFQLFLDLDGNGSMETVVNSASTLEPNVIRYNNANTPNFSGGIVRAFDGRPVPLEQKYRFAIETHTSGNFKTACLRWNTIADPNTYVIPELPHGNHKIKWFVSDGCGNEQICEYPFVIKDCKAPSLKCYNGLSANMGVDKSLTLNMQFFIEQADDNCTPSNLIIHGIRKAGQGTGFPFLPNGAPQTTVTFDCSQLGFQLVEVWGMDLAGNADFCQTYVHVQSNGACNNATATVAGAVLTEHGHGLEEANVHIEYSTINGTPPATKQELTDNNGHYVFDNSVPIAINYKLTPIKDNDPLNGVSTFDLVLINKHILGIEPLVTPNKLIAADVNRNGSITTFDLVELRKLILGIYTDFPDNTSWRFVDKAYTFPDPTNPWKEVFPESKSVWNFQANSMEDDFVAIKIGDINSNSVANSLLYSEDRADGTLLFDVEDRFVKAGERFTATFTADNPVLAYQFTMNYTDLEIESILPGAGMKAENFAVFADQHAMTSSVQVPEGTEEITFKVQFRAKAAGQLSKMLGVSSRITRSEAYPDVQGLDKYDIGFRFNNGGEHVVTGLGFELYQNVPNPWVNKTQIGFYLPQAGDATLTIYDDLGRAVFTETADYDRGYNAIFIEHALLDKPGVLYYTLDTPHGKATRKMIQVK
ncbi:MAG: hypothetical protein JNJ90_00720 [Saprospiraceae bacterium]|nr:hypothetical protein [Saprospiraceae bacterium]